MEIPYTSRSCCSVRIEGPLPPEEVGSVLLIQDSGSHSAHREAEVVDRVLGVHGVYGPGVLYVREYTELYLSYCTMSGSWGNLGTGECTESYLS